MEARPQGRASTFTRMTTQTPDPDIEALLELHARDRQAHLNGDAELLTAAMADHIWEASRGQLTRLSREDVRQRFAQYFEAVRYSVWDDLVQPHVSVSTDRSVAWMAIHIEAKLAPRDAAGDVMPRGFDSSWIATYEKHGGMWAMVAIASSVAEHN